MAPNKHKWSWPALLAVQRSFQVMAFTDVENLNAKQFTLLTWFMWGAGLLLTSLRFGVRCHHLRRLFLDDAFQLIGMISLTVLAAMTQLQRDIIYTLKAIYPPEGDPAAKTFKHEVTNSTKTQAKLQFASVLVFWLCLWAIKGSLLLFYHRLFCSLHDYMKWWWIVTVTCIITLIACVLANFLECLPLGRRFELDLQGSCPAANGIRFVEFTTGLDILTDVLLMALPIKLLIGLHITTKQKIGVGVIFGLSFLIVIFSILRLKEVYISLSESDPNLNVSLALWSILEASVAVVVGALPSLKSLIKGKGASSNGSHTIGPTGPYPCRPNGGPDGSNGSKIPTNTVFPLNDMKQGKGDRDLEEHGTDWRTISEDTAVIGITVERHTFMKPDTTAAFESRDEFLFVPTHMSTCHEKTIAEADYALSLTCSSDLAYNLLASSIVAISRGAGKCAPRSPSKLDLDLLHHISICEHPLYIMPTTV